MKTRTVILVIAAWMGLIIGGYLVVRGGDNENSTTRAQAPATDPSPTPDQVITSPATTTTQTTPAQTTPAQTTTPAATNPADPGPSTSTSTAATDPATTKVYTPAELEKLRTSDPDKYLQLTVDPQDRNPILARKQEQAIGSHPAFQKLPYEGRGISVDFTGARDGERIELTVDYSTTKAKAAKALDAFLASAGDTSAGYSVTYRKAGGR